MSIGSADAVGEWQRQLVALLHRTLAEWCIEIEIYTHASTIR